MSCQISGNEWKELTEILLLFKKFQIINRKKVTEILLGFKKKCIFQIHCVTEETLKYVCKKAGILLNGLIPVLSSEINLQNLR